MEKVINIQAAGMAFEQELLSDWCKENGFSYQDKSDDDGDRYSAISVTKASMTKFQDWVIKTRSEWSNLRHYFMESPDANKWRDICDHICQLADEVYYFSKRKQDYERLEFEDISDD